MKMISFVDELRKILSNVNWARAGLGLPLLEDKIEKRPLFNAIPVGPRPTPEGESLPPMNNMSDGLHSTSIHSSNTSKFLSFAIVLRKSNDKLFVI